MKPIGVFLSTQNSGVDLESYIFHSTIKTIESVNDKIILVICAIVLILSITQTFLKNKRIDRVLAYLNEAYSDGKFESNQVYFREQIITCYRFDQRFSHIPNPNRSILLIIATHIQVLMLIVIRTLFIRRSEPVHDCFSFHYPYKVLECENSRDPCRLNETESSPKCTYYYFQMTHLIPMVTSIITWHYALRYFVVKLICFVRWALFRDNDQPRMLCWCCGPARPRIIRCSMYLNYIILWCYLFVLILFGFMQNRSPFGIPINMLGSVWAPMLTTIDRFCSLYLGLISELMQNWLDALENGAVLQVFESKGLFLDNVEPLIHLISKETKASTSSKNRILSTNEEVAVDSTPHT
ncbi:unnamed protein product [Rotaria sp. Silwood1]|nr:unnamed protein product [Rotaria sp. Silwood1]CAF3761283.1 unnamed protein product [Rotaria sp. Silwood1]CAF3818346.1 unnamed protein product [Rotaria sp. Silwood1]CAF4920304.1 unnamed protein product [Rotaria sp. Silwood1]CAF4945808.1 unnamed protein product [Rotaria sp. Silwood1]